MSGVLGNRLVGILHGCLRDQSRQASDQCL